VSCDVTFDGFTPIAFAGALEVVVAATVVVATATVVVVVAVGAAVGGASFFSCPGAFAELPGAPPPFPFPLASPFPFPADAVPANARTLRTSTHVPVSRIWSSPSSPFPHVSR